MDQTLINIAVGLVMAVGGVAVGALGWFARTLWDRIEAHSKKLSDLEVKMAGEYVSRADMTDILSDLKAAVGGMVSDLKADIGYIRNRLDGLPQRRHGDPP